MIIGDYRLGISLILFVLAAIILLPQYQNTEQRNLDTNKSILDDKGQLEGISYNQEGKSIEGYNLFYRKKNQSVYLVDNSFSIRYSWNVSEVNSPLAISTLVLEGGELILVDTSDAVWKFDSNGDVLWKRSISINGTDDSFGNDQEFHNEVEYIGNDKIIVPYKKKKRINGTEFFDNIIAVLDTEDGQITDRVSAYELAEDVEGFDPSETEFLNIASTFDTFHINTLEYVREEGRFMDEGDIIFSFRNYNSVGVIDWDKKEIKKMITGETDEQHYATQVNRDSLLIYNNNPSKTKYNEVVRLNLMTGDRNTVLGPDELKLNSEIMGQVQKVDENRYLVLDSLQGKAYEYSTKQDRSIWEADFDQRTFRFERMEKDCMKRVFNGLTESSRSCFMMR